MSLFKQLYLLKKQQMMNLLLQMLFYKQKKPLVMGNINMPYKFYRTVGHMNSGGVSLALKLLRVLHGAN
jgi:hypothetical protein